MAKRSRRTLGGTVKRELLDHVIVIDERHLQRLLHEYVCFYNNDRVHTVLCDSPTGRPSESPPESDARVIGRTRLGGLHNRYAWSEAAQQRSHRTEHSSRTGRTSIENRQVIYKKMKRLNIE